jgi:cephalosporin hydroxylase
MLKIDMERGLVQLGEGDGMRELPIGSQEAFRAISRAWIRSGWDAKYVYSFSWMGRPIIQLPEDMIRVQEVVYAQRPDVILETGIAHGGSLIFYAGLMAAMGHGRVVGVDIEIRPHNRAAIEAHEMYGRISMLEGSSIDPDTVARVHAAIAPGERVLLVLDSNHSRDHVLAELRAYADLVADGSYIVVCDGIMQEVAGAPRSAPDWAVNNPLSAIDDFLAERTDFVLEEPVFPFNEGTVTERITYWPNAYIRRLRAA